MTTSLFFVCVLCVLLRLTIKELVEEFPSLTLRVGITDYRLLNMSLFIRAIGSIRGQILIVTAGFDYCWMAEKRRKKAKKELEAHANALRRKGNKERGGIPGSSCFVLCLCSLLSLAANDQGFFAPNLSPDSMNQ